MAQRSKVPDPRILRFGKLVRSLRRARGYTQETLAELGELSPDTVRRLERGGFSPSLDTLFKLVAGLRLDLSTLFTAFEMPDREVEHELAVMAHGLSPAEISVALRVLGLLTELLGGVVRTRELRGDRE